MSTQRRAPNSKSPHRSTAGRGGAFIVEMTIEAPAWLRDACQAIVRIAAALEKPSAPRQTVEMNLAPTDPAFAKRSPLSKRLALARREALLAYKLALADGRPKAEAERAASAAHRRLCGRTCTGRSLWSWMKAADAHGGVEHAPLASFLQNKCVPHKRARQL